MFTRITRRGVLSAAAVASASALVLTGCGGGDDALSSGGDNQKVVVGSADFTESQTIAAIYAEALNDAGIEAETQPAIGAREAYVGAVQDGSVSVVPDYSGNLLQYFDEVTAPLTEDEVMEFLPPNLPEGVGVLDPSSAENKDAMVVTRATADEYGLTSIEDLAAVCSEMTLGAPPEFQERSYGLPGLQANYGCVPANFSPINDAGGPLTVQALLDNTVQVADIFTTTPAIKQNDLVVLEDPENNFLPQHVLPLYHEDDLSQDARDVLNKVSATLTTDDLIALNERVSGDEKASPEQAAKDWVADHNLS
ncbi:ABC transporter substrate-binding protein [Rothia sp. AR01]|uniref:ABC transporter substrate-binding protein n=1 Tax=Rothia santali TaxID=2949643 RepID=A0A9X2HCB7_9MICC|nr:ABC transporter substrate-binding protein [Rothia santali]MCP3425655.1 ABC transporter substrate-binding protein [Rothia santali]